MSRYTFSTLGEDGKRYYPGTGKSGPGLLDFNWTTELDLSKIVTWPELELLDIIAIEFCNTEIIEITNKDLLEYKVIKEMK